MPRVRRGKARLYGICGSVTQDVLKKVKQEGAKKDMSVAGIVGLVLTQWARDIVLERVDGTGQLDLFAVAESSPDELSLE